MPGFVVGKVADALNEERPADEGLAAPAPRHGVQGRTCTTRASRRASRSCACSSRAAATSSLRSVGRARSSSTASCTRASSGRATRSSAPTASCSSRRTGSSSTSRSGSRRASSCATSSRGNVVCRPVPAPSTRLSLVETRRWCANAPIVASRARGTIGVAEPTPLSSGAGYLGVLAGRRSTRPRGRPRRQLVRDRPRSQLAPLEARGARVETVDIRSREEVERMLALGLRPRAPPRRAGEPAGLRARARLHRGDERDRRPPRRRAVGRARPVVFASSLHVYGDGAGRRGDGPDTPYGAQGDLAHLSKIYGELVLGMHARRAGFGLALMRLGIVYGPSPAEHDRPESQTVVDKFRQLAAAGEPLPARRRRPGDDRRRPRRRRRADPARRGPRASTRNVAAETVTVADVAALAQGERRRDAPDLRVRRAVRRTGTPSTDYLRP